MPTLVLQSEIQTPADRFQGTVAYLRIYASTSFYSLEGVQVTGGQVGSQFWYQQYTCPITDGLIEIPEVTLQTTTDSNVPNATYTAVFYDQSGRQQNTKLGNFFVDPQYLQSSVQSEIIVSGAGTSAANGTYTYRGQHNTRGYWNLFGQDDSTTDYAIVWTGSAWIMTNFAGATLYTIDTSSQYPWDSNWTIEGGNAGLAPVPAVAQGIIVVAATWAELTISNQGFVPNFWTRTTWDVQQIKQYINLIGIPEPYASMIVAGKTYLTRDPSLSTLPRAVAANDYDWLAINKTIYLDGPEYLGDLADAIAGIGATVCELRITANCAVSADTDIPDNILLSFEGNGRLTVSGGSTVTIASMREQPVKKIFYTNSTSDYVLIGFGAVSECKWSWWGGQGTGSDDNHAFTQMFASLAANAGGRWTIQEGTFYCTNQLVPSRTHGSGCGSGFEGATFNNQGTVLRNSNPTGTNPIFKLHQGTVQVTLEDMAFDQEDSATAFCLYLYGTQGQASMYTIDLTRLCFNALADSAQTLVQIESVGVSTDWECVDVTFFECTWGMNTNTKGFSCNTVNSKLTFFSPLAFLGVGSTWFQSNDTGWLRIVDADIRGPAGADYSTTETPNRVQAGVNLSSGSHIMTITNPTTPRLTMADLAQAVTGTNIPANNYFDDILSDYSAHMYYAASGNVTNGTATVYRQNPPTGLAHAGIVFNGQRGPTFLESYVDEAVAYSVYFTSLTTEIFTPVNFFSCNYGGRVYFEGTVLVNNYGGQNTSCSWGQSGGIGPIINHYSPVIINTTILRGPGSFNGFRVLPTGYLYENNTNSFVKPIQNWLKQNDNFTNTPSNITNQIQVLDRTGEFDVANNTVASISALTPQQLQADDANKVLLRLGLSNVETGLPFLYYDFYRDGETGFLRMTGNQGDAAFKALQLDDRFIDLVSVTSPLIIANTKFTTAGICEVTDKTTSSGFNYAVGAGGTAIQGTSRSTAFTCTGLSNIIALNAASLAAGAEVTCRVTNASITAQHIPAFGFAGNYTAKQDCFISDIGVGHFDITTRNNDSGANTTGPIVVVNWYGGSGS